MSDRQMAALRALGDGGAHSLVEVATRMDTTLPAAQRVLDALYRRSLVRITDTGRWCLSDRGRTKLNGKGMHA